LSLTLWDSHKRCLIDWTNFSDDFEKEKHTFSGSATEKSDTKTFQIYRSSQVDFIPHDILTEFENLNGLAVSGSNLPIIKSGLLKPDFQKIEFLYFGSNQIKSIEAKAFEYLNNLKWISLEHNQLRALSNNFFAKNPELIYVNFQENRISSIHPNFFDGLLKLKLIQFYDSSCIQTDIGCKTCLIDQADLKNKLQDCYKN
jgi:hypothetical protein